MVGGDGDEIISKASAAGEGRVCIAVARGALLTALQHQARGVKTGPNKVEAQREGVVLLHDVVDQLPVLMLRE